MLFDGESRTPALKTLCAAQVPTVWLYIFRHTCLIYGLELSALVAYFEDHALSLRGSCCWMYLDNNNFLAALFRGDSNTEVIAILAARFWQLARRFNVCVWFPRVRSNLNPADLPNRTKKLPYRAAFSPRLRSSGALFRSRRPHLGMMHLKKPPIARKPLTFRKKFHPVRK